jgi:integrase
MAVRKLTKRSVESARRPAPGKRSFVFDTELKGFAVVVYPNGRRVYFVEYGRKGHRTRYTIGQHGKWKIDEARSHARDVLVKADKGGDPAADRATAAEMPTFGAWVKGYLAELEGKRKRIDQVAYLLKGGPGGRGRNATDSPAWRRWHSRPLDAIKPLHVKALMRELGEKRGRKILANRTHATLAACFHAAQREGVITENPCSTWQRYPENDPRQRVLDANELIRLVKAVDALENVFERTLLRVLLETGCRKSEAVAMRWEDVDLEAGVWRIPSPKAGRPQALPLPGVTVARLVKLPRAGGPWVFPGVTKGTHRVEIKTLWREVCSAAKIIDLHVHDIRRSVGLAIARTAGLVVAQKLLRHASPSVTSRVYVPLGVEELRGALEVAVAPGKVLPMKRGRR